MGRGISALLLALVLLAFPGVARPVDMAAVQPADAELLMVVRDDIVLPPADLPALPEPAVLIMMVLGICVIGYRVRRENEPFR